MKAERSKRLHWGLRILLWINVLNSLLLIGAYLNTHISPNSVPHISLLGLAYPILLLIELIALGFWVVFKWKYTIISLLTLLIGVNHLRHFYAVTWFQSELTEPFKLLSYNVHIFDLYNLENRDQNRDEIFSFLKEQDADVLCFQEFYHQEDPSFVTKDSMIPLLETPFYHERYTHEMKGEKYFGVATFSKFPIVNQGEIPFENDENNFCIYSDIVKGSDTIRVYNAHIGSIRFQSDDYEFFGDENGPAYIGKQQSGRRILGRLKVAFEKRAVQAETICTNIESSPYPVVLCGDLNDTPVSYCYRQFNRILEDAFVESGNGVGQTYIGNMPSYRIDYVFYDESFESANFETHQVFHSDHKPVTCSLGLKK